MRFDPWCAVGDTHGDMIDRRADRAFRSFVGAYRPKIRVHVGDFIDARALRNGASEEEKRESMACDFDRAMEFMEWYRPTHVCLGNHDIRLWDTMRKGGPLADYCKQLIGEWNTFAKKIGCKVKTYDAEKGVMKIGRMKFAHGFFCGTNAARQMAQAFGSVMFGHGHAIDVASSPADHRRAARMIGCLCRLRFTYNRAHVAALRQAHGWAYGPLFRNGSYQAFQAEMIGGKVVLAEGIKVIAA